MSTRFFATSPLLLAAGLAAPLGAQEDFLRAPEGELRAPERLSGRPFAWVGTQQESTPRGSLRPQEINPFRPWYRASGQDTWYFDFILGIEWEPDYAGSDDRELGPEANARVMFKDPWNNRHILSLGNWLSVFDLNEDWAVSINLEYEEARDPEDNAALAGLDPVKATLELAPGLHYRHDVFSFSAVAQPDILDRGKGFVWFVGAGYDETWLDDALRVAASVDLSGGDARHMRTEFGITSIEAMRTSYAPYRPGSALKSLSWDLAAEYFLTDEWTLFAGAEVEYYFSEAADSPLIAQQGSDWTFGFVLGTRYSF